MLPDIVIVSTANIPERHQPWRGLCRRPQGQVLANIVDFGLNVQAAGDAARYRHYGSSSPTGEDMEGRGLLRVESGVPDEVVRALRGRGHDVEYSAGGYGGY